MLSNAPAETSTLIKSVIGDITQNSSGGLLSIGLILAIWSASNGMTAIMNSFNVAYDVEDSRNGIVLKLLSVVFTVVMGVVFVVALALPTLGSVISHFLFGPLGFDEQVKWFLILLELCYQSLLYLSYLSCYIRLHLTLKRNLSQYYQVQYLLQLFGWLGHLVLVGIFQILVTILKHMAVSQVSSFCYYGYISQVLL